jgi:cysteine desulfurase/selenocysteine lyase
MVREDFPPLKEVVYLDSAATSLTPLPVVEAMAQYYTRYRANVHRGAHRLSVRASDAFDSARAAVAKLIGARDPAEVLFTKNATEGLNMAAFGLRLREGDKVVTTTLEHHSNLMP